MFAKRYANYTTCSLANIYTFLHNNILFKYTVIMSYSNHTNNYTKMRFWYTQVIIQKYSFAIMTTEEHVCMLLHKKRNFKEIY